MGHLLDAVAAGDDERVWFLCANDTYGENAYTSPRAIWGEVLDCINIANDEALGAISVCLLEHMLETDFAYFAAELSRELNAGNAKVAGCLSTCSKFGESLYPKNSPLFDQLKDKARSMTVSQPGR